MEVRTELKQVLKKLRLSGILSPSPRGSPTGGGRALLRGVPGARLERRDREEGQGTIERRIRQGSLDPDETIERFEWDVPITMDRDRVRDLFNLSFVGNHENVLICGPVGVGKTFLANALGHTAVRRGFNVLMLRAQTLLKRLHQSRADNSFGKEPSASSTRPFWSSMTSACSA